MADLRSSFLHHLYRLAPFNLKGDLVNDDPCYTPGLISCLICTARPPAVLLNLLNDLEKQDFPQNSVEVIIWDNRPIGSADLNWQDGRALTIRVFRDRSSDGLIGKMRNDLIAASQGEYILFLDDDTRLRQKNFLQQALVLFKEDRPDVILPSGTPLPIPEAPDYLYLDQYSFTTRCLLCTREVLKKLKGFREDIVAYDDIDLGIRSSCLAIKAIKTTTLSYQHPSLFFATLQKPLAIGQSILTLRDHYPLFIWILIYLNALRFLPLLLIPITQYQQWARISLGILLAPFTGQKKTYRQ